ncbi:GCN5-related N-acetyltransferase [Methylocaldum marinum]|uniref:GCN5-related N-acetyltransferase n=1 Tax=Methylocaldum marinum TaxID=1432792 RepID=A0A250L0U7_9GAMM|nr:GNAT family N-acetyltransferase [Methylocaldum marinum]BBA35669.1 GCN5-related N-acetyltransferase [Methylocaldum marinum]
MNIDIRTATEADAKAACEVLRRSISECCVEDHGNDPSLLAAWLENKTPEKVRSWLSAGGSYGVVAEVRGRIVGFAMLLQSGEIPLSYLIPEARFRGLGKAMLMAIEREAQRRGLRQLNLESTKTARDFYLRNGFSPSGPSVVEFAMEAYPMCKGLSGDPLKASIQEATLDHVHEIAVMVGELLNEIMDTIGIKAFNFNLKDTKANIGDFIESGKYVVFVAKTENAMPVGFIALYESRALYAEGVFGTIPEFYVRPEFRSQNFGQRLLMRARAFAESRGWKRLEVTTPLLPQFDKTQAFYEREGFTITGGRKLKLVL